MVSIGGVVTTKLQSMTACAIATLTTTYSCSATCSFFRIYPTSVNTDDYWLSWHASENCMLFEATMFPATNQWYHMVITYDGSGSQVYRNGVVTTDGIDSNFCGECHTTTHYSCSCFF